MLKNSFTESFCAFETFLDIKLKSSFSREITHSEQQLLWKSKPEVRTITAKL